MKRTMKFHMKLSPTFSVIFFTLFLFAFSATLAAEISNKPGIKYSTNTPPSAQLYYLVTAVYSGFPLNGEADVHWRVTGSAPNQTYSITTETRSAILGKIVEANSFGDIDTFGLAPTKYEEKMRKKPMIQTTFDREARKISFSESKETYPINGGEQDRTSAVWQLVGIARGAPTKFVPKSQWSFFVAGRRDAEKWTFAVEKNVTLATSFGKIAAVHITKIVADPKGQRIDVWLAPTMEWYPVRIKFRDANDDTIEQNLVRIQSEKKVDRFRSLLN